jgi:hypothetical protein
MHTYSKFMAGAFAGAMMLGAVQAHAVTLAPFASYTMKGGPTDAGWTRIGLTGGNFSNSGSPNITFNFLDTTKYLDDLDAKITASASESGVAAHDQVFQDGISGSFQITYEGPTQTFMGKSYVHDVTNLLSGEFTNGTISGAGTSGALHASTDVGTVVFTSDIITTLSSAAASDFSFALAGITPALSYTPGQSINSFKAGTSGAFSVASVPEPATWAVMITGLGLVGLAARRRRARAA